MLGLNGNAAELAGLVSSEEEYSTGPFRVPFEHPGTYVNAAAMGVTGSMTTLYGIGGSPTNGIREINACQH